MPNSVWEDMPVAELTSHKFFANVRWTDLHDESIPTDVHVPQFIYADPNGDLETEDDEIDGDESKPTPIRSGPRTPYQTLSRNSTARRTTVTRRPVSEREAMKQLINCVSMSAHKKVLESGRKPRILASVSRRSRSASLKELRFHPQEDPRKILVNVSDSEEQTDTDMDAPPSPSPTPRPGSVMSKRSTTSNATVSLTQRSSDFSQRTGTDLPVKESDTPQRGGEDDSQSHLRVASSLSYEHTTFNGLENRHTLIMGDIHSIEGRLKKLVSAIAK
ncbi:hypothetical protein EDD18DRAFT_1391315 [Armillaria luteobubalina]|uniref:Uncharacterized protein n=1 Tax=Armillaria luteobubalina TaxID=153913 RepID=A0AA39NZF9_9AGAR|nr:hypothetical protein EDD18DRAFT_1391315 [Armillaria luteobubalina]